MKEHKRRLLTDTAFRATRATLLAQQIAENPGKAFSKPPKKRTFKITDGGGLFLEVPPNDCRGWRFSYRRPANGQQNTLTFGSYPDVPLGDARTQRDAARALLAQGIDPATHKLEVRNAARAVEAVLFCKVANDWWTEVMASAAERTRTRAKHTFNKLTAAFGERDMKSITESELGDLLRSIYESGRKSTTRRVLAMASRIWRYGISERKVDRDITVGFKDNKDRFKHKVQKFPAVTDAIERDGMPLEQAEALVTKLLRDIRGYWGQPETIAALEMMAYTFPRPHNIQEMRWEQLIGVLESDFRQGEWVISADDMKMDKPHRIWLPRQALAILKHLWSINGHTKYVFTTDNEPLRASTMGEALRLMGYDTIKVQSVHGFRSMASTLLNEWGEFSDDAIELQMAHSDKRKVRGIYNKATKWDERVRMMQYYADQLDELRRGRAAPLKVVEAA